MNNEKSVVESEETEIEDDAAKDTAVTPIVYNITSYGESARPDQSCLTVPHVQTLIDSEPPPP